MFLLESNPFGPELFTFELFTFSWDFTDSDNGNVLGADFLSSQILLAAILLQKKSIMQVLTSNILMRISIVKLSASVFNMTGRRG